ncbi:NAD(P)H dehydrogenase [Sphingomonas sp. AAP5]|uniref:NAD(P)H-dependent oxidoreductase n=1 Tax=Sphingomonas sp. AAP5 TaxID=1523415 RepID=UPI001056F4D7|nr:NAD(P)H-dependent oxidoreductase [Sphingomonas sp. AAP5]QBM75470.1 NAD(P)H dehydrogenase [Sphingomonas sp. AAP5]
MPDTRSKPPRHVVILCHPEQDSFNAAMAAAYSATVREQGHEVIVRDLYAMGFHPVLKSAERPGPGERQFADVAEELAVLKDSDVFVLVYPIWFGGPPAMLKGYVERVLGSGVLPDAVYEGTAKGVLAGKQLLSFTTSGLKEIWLDEMGQLRALTQAFDHYIEHAFAMAPSRHVHFGHITPDMEPGWARRHLEEVRGQARAIVRALDGLIVAE